MLVVGSCQQKVNGALKSHTENGGDKNMWYKNNCPQWARGNVGQGKIREAGAPHHISLFLVTQSEAPAAGLGFVLPMLGRCVTFWH